MLTITHAAGGYLSRMLADHAASENTAVRLVAGADGMKMALDQERPGDATFDHDGRRVLLLDEQAAQALSERTLDVQSTTEGPRLGIS